MKGFRQKLTRNKRTTFDLDNYEPQRTNSITNTVGSVHSPQSETGEPVEGETPEATAVRLVKLFCMSDPKEGAEVALLPSIVEAAESSPAAAAECVRYIRKFMYKDFWSQTSYVYNAIMLMRILAENPGLTFTRNMDKKFTETVRELLRNCVDPHVVHFMIETLQEFESRAAVDEGLGRLVEMWMKEKTKSKTHSNPQGGRSGLWQRPQAPMWTPQTYRGDVTPHQHRRSSGRSSLPKPAELRKRLDEARTTAGVLADVVNTSTPATLLKHDLADDLSSRCRRATSQMLEYLEAKNPTPDNSEMEALLGTHEMLQQTLHHYHRAVLEARKDLGVGEARRTEDGSQAAVMTPAGKGKANAPQSPGAGPDGGSWANVPNSDGVSNGASSGLAGLGSSAYSGVMGSNMNGPNNEDDDIAAAIAASQAQAVNSRGGRRGYPGEADAGGPASEAENPFSDSVHVHSSRSSSQARPAYGGGGGRSAAGGSSSAAAAATAGGAGGGAVAYVDSDSDSDREYLHTLRKNKSVQGPSSFRTGEGSGSSSAAAGLASPPPVPSSSSKPGSSAQGLSGQAGQSGQSSWPRPTASGRSSPPGGPLTGPEVDAAAYGSSQYSGGPVYRY